MLLFRTHRFDTQTQAFCERLDAESGLDVVCLVDETQGALDVGRFSKVPITTDGVKALGLHCPRDYPWRCGDYGLYLAAQRFPDVKQFWLIEYDVRIHSSSSLKDFFHSFAPDEADLIAPMLSERDYDWWWYPSMRSGARPVFGCLFPILRASAALIGIALEHRRRISRSLAYRLFWPNDECFLATTAQRNGCRILDMNDAANTVYTDESFSFDAPLSGEILDQQEPDGLIYHPVLYGVDYQRKRNQVAQPSTGQEILRRKMRNRLSRYV